MVHARQNVIAGSVQDAFDPEQAIACKPFADGADDGNASRHGRLEQQLALVLLCQRQQLDAMDGNQLLVRGDHRFTRLK